MLLDLWEWFLLINDGIDLVFSNLASGTSTIPFTLIFVTILLGLISYFGWRSTDIPDLPPAPRPPYVIQITAGPGSGGSRQTIADVRLLSGGTFFDGSEILSRYHNISRNQATNTTSSPQPGTSASSSPGGGGNNRNVTTRGTPLIESAVPNVRRRIPGRSFLLGLFRRPNTFVTPVPVVPNAIRAHLNSPNLVVYHRVNVYHHHIHSHLGQNASNSDNTRSDSNSSNLPAPPPSVDIPSPGQNTPGDSEAPSLQEEQGESRSNYETSRSDETSIDAHNEQVTDRHHISGTSETGGNLDDISVHGSASTGSVQIQAAVARDSQEDWNPIASTSSSSFQCNMPASSSSNAQGEGDRASHTQKDATGSSSPPPDGEDVHFTIKFLNDTQMDVTSQMGEKIVDFKRRHFATEMSENKTVRLIFNGRVLDNDNKTIREFGIFDHCVVHCLIVNRQQNQDQNRRTGGGATGPTGRPQGDSVQGNVRRVVGLPEPGMFFVAFIGIFLVFLWFICIHFGQHLFTQSAVVSLTVLTAIFLIGIVACYLPLPTN